MTASIKLETYGCAANQNHSQIMAGLLEKKGYQVVDKTNKADLIIINSCSVKQKTENKIRYKLKQLTSKGQKLIVAGCMPLSEPEVIASAAPQASQIGPHNCQQVVEVVEATLEGKQMIKADKKKESKLCLPKKKDKDKKVIGIAEIAQGCVNNCAYCSTKLAKLGLHSYDSNRILQEVKQAVGNGCGEIWLTAQDTGCYGFDKSQIQLPELMQRISKIDNEFRVRIGMMNPGSAYKIVDELVAAYGSDKFYKFLHLPVQSGSDSVLEAMDRDYSIKEFKEIVNQFRQVYPELTLATDLIAGFPTESESDFEQSLQLLQEIRPDITHVSMYGPRPHTKAKKELSPHDTEVIKERSRRLSKLARQVTRKKNEELVGDEFEVLLSQPGTEGGFQARNQNYKLIIVPEGELGQFRQVKVIKNEGPYLMGETIS